MRVLSLQKKLTIFICSIAAAVVLIAVFVIIPSFRQISELKQSINNTEEYIEQKYLRTQHTKKSIRRLSEVLLQAEKFYNATLKRGEELKIITQLESLAAKNNITQKIDLQYVEPEPETDKEKKGGEKKPPLNLPHYQLSFSNTGEFPDLVNFLQDLERLDYYLITNPLQWGKEGDKRGESVSGVNIKFNAIVYATGK